MSADSTVFLSYSRTNLEAANALRAQLQAAGFAVFKDDARLHSGERWLTQLQKAVTGCQAFVVLVGQDGVQRWVSAEVEVALCRHFNPRAVDGKEPWRLPLHPILLGDMPPDVLPPFLSLFQAVRWQHGQPLPEDLILALREGHQRAPRADAAPHFEGCPYLGLGSFKLKDSPLFFGRTRETLEALQRIGDQKERGPHTLRLNDRRSVDVNQHGADLSSQSYIRWLQVAGHSGSGKSSLVQAGLLPMIERGALWPRTGHDHWRILGPMVPGAAPLARLAEVLEHALVPDSIQRSMQARLERLLSSQDSLAFALRDAKQPDTAFLLLIDQFEEIFTLAEATQRQHFDALLARALTDPDCPLYVISTVRSDFEDRMQGDLPALTQIVEGCSHRYLLPTISADGLREAIEGPARLAGLDVSEVTELMLEQARGEPGALPLVEHALLELWAERLPASAQANGQSSMTRLSRQRFEARGGLAGMLSSAADALLARIDTQIKGGRNGALELLLRLTRIDPAGGQAPRHTRRRISRAEAIQVAGNGRDALGQKVLQMLSGERDVALPADSAQGSLRLVTVEDQGVDLIHETLLRTQADAGQGNEAGQKPPQPYWPTLYEHIARNRDRDVRRQQLAWQVEAWQQAPKWLRWSRLVPLGFWRYRRLRVPGASPEGRFMAASRTMFQAMLSGVVVYLGLTYLYQSENVFITAYHVNTTANYVKLHVVVPLRYLVVEPLWAESAPHLPDLVPIPPPAIGEYEAGCRQGRDTFKDTDGTEFDCDGLPEAHPVRLPQVCAMGRNLVTFKEFDTYLWARYGWRMFLIGYPDDAGWGRGQRPVINVSWRDAQDYLHWLNGLPATAGTGPGGRYRLPTAAEWEYAARVQPDGSLVGPFPWGPASARGRASCNGCVLPGTDRVGTAPVGSYPAGRSGLGLNDMAGNVWQWVNDKQDPDDSDENAAGVLRGGSWVDDPQFLRAAYRDDFHPVPLKFIGFRVCRGSPIGPQATGAVER